MGMGIYAGMTVNYCSMTVNYCGILSLEIIGFSNCGNLP